MDNSLKSITNQTKKSRPVRKSKKDFRDKYFIRDVENITGIKAFTIRVWEQRYGMLLPKRTDTNIRYYEEEDLKYMMNVALLNNHGYKISKIAEMSRDEVQRRTLNISENNTTYQSQVQSLTNSMIQFDEKEFNKTLSLNMLKLGMIETTSEIIFPFLQHVGILWLSGTINVAHEHFITNLIKQRLYVAIDQVNTPKSPSAKKFILFLPNGENHELSLLFASYILKTRGHEVVYIGSSTPIEDLQQLCKVHEPDILFCAITNANSNMPIQVYVNTLSRNWPNIDILLTGNQIIRRRDLKCPDNCKVVGAPKDFFAYLDKYAPTQI